MDFGIKGIDPEPRRGYRTRAARDKHLEEFSNAVWQRVEATHARGGPIGEWPNRQAFKSNWPLLAEDLIIADWKHAGAAAAMGKREPRLHLGSEQDRNGRLVEVDIVAEIDHDLLDPPPPVVVDWRTTYARELAAQPELLFELAQEDKNDHGRGIELVMERAQLRLGERAAVRGWLQHRGALEPPYGGVVPAIAEDLAERPQTVWTNLRNGLDRLRWLGQADAQRRGKDRRVRRGLVSDRSNGLTGRVRSSDVPAAAGASDRARREPRSGRGSGSGHLREVPAQAAGVL